jgi:RNA polymerase sigma-70 factor (ECF subfamily)
MEPRSSADADLAYRAVAGDAAAFQDLTRRWYRPVSAFIWKRIQKADLVEDLTQETFLEAFKSLKSGPAPEQFSSWLFGIAVNRCGKYLRRKQLVRFAGDEVPEQSVGDNTLQLEESEEQTKWLDRLEVGLSELPPETRDLLERKHRQGQTCEQIAQATGRPVGTIKSLLARTYKQLRERLDPHAEREDYTRRSPSRSA